MHIFFIYPMAKRTRKNTRCSACTLALRAYLNGRRRYADDFRLHEALIRLGNKDLKPSEASSFVKVIRSLCVKSFSTSAFQILGLLVPYVCDLPHKDVAGVCAGLFFLKEVCERNALMHTIMRNARSVRYRGTGVHETLRFTFAVLYFIKSGLLFKGIELKHGSAEAYFSVLVSDAAADANATFSSIFMLCIVDVHGSLDSFSRASRIKRVWESIGRPVLNLPIVCNRYGRQHGANSSWLYKLNIQEKMFLYAHPSHYEKFMRSTFPSHHDRYVFRAVRDLLYSTVSCTEEEVAKAMRPDPFYTREVIGLPLTGCKWRLFADIASRYPQKMQGILQENYETPEYYVNSITSGTSNYVLARTLVQDMAAFTETYVPKRSERWTFIRAIAELSAEKTEKTNIRARG